MFRSDTDVRCLWLIRLAMTVRTTRPPLGGRSDLSSCARLVPYGRLVGGTNKPSNDVALGDEMATEGFLTGAVVDQFFKLAQFIAIYPHVEVVRFLFQCSTIAGCVVRHGRGQWLDGQMILRVTM